MKTTILKRPPPLAVKKPKSKFSFILFFLVIFCASVGFVILSVAPNQPKASEPPLLYSNQIHQDLRLTLIDAIRQANQSIHLVMFGLSDPAILDALAHKDIPTSVYYDVNGSPKLWSALPNAQLHPVRGYGLMHQKILILDKETVFIGSANMTTASLRMHDNLVIGLKNKKVAKFLIDKTPDSSGYLEATVGGQKVELWLLPDPRGHALHDVKKKIRMATKSLRIALFTFTHPTLIDEVIAAHKRGLSVSVIIDMHSGLGASHKAVDQLKNAGVRTYMSRGVQLLHHKFILIDDRTLLSGSANWTKAAFYKNSDCIIVLHNMTEDQKTFMNTLWHKIESEAQPVRPKPPTQKSRVTQWVD
jgi:phosphatidylserine/phosphatidylglycerophosphate/cardiolipin synthase-like enzyme